MYKSSLSAVALVSFFLAGCGGSSDNKNRSSSSTQSTSQSSALSSIISSAASSQGASVSSSASLAALYGTAAVGAAITNADVIARCADGSGFVTPVKTTSDGSFSGDVNSGAFPCALNVIGNTPEQTLFSLAQQTGRTNITPWTDLLIASASGLPPAEWFASPDAALVLPVLPSELAQLTQRLVSAGYISAGSQFDPFSVTFVIGDAHDQTLDKLQEAIIQSALNNYVDLLNRIINGDVNVIPPVVATSSSSLSSRSSVASVSSQSSAVGVISSSSSSSQSSAGGIISSSSESSLSSDDSSSVTSQSSVSSDISSASSSAESSDSSASSSSSSDSGPYADWREIEKAFPGAEGFGAATSGGRGGDIYYVTTLSDSEEPGTLRYAINQTGPRIILFKVSGYIHLNGNLDIHEGDISILGQTAPGDGITLRGGSLRISQGVENVVIRFIRSRLGVIDGEADSLDGRYLKNIVIDHSSFSWAIDETTSLYASNNVSFQWSLISESLNDAGHGKGEHGYGSNWGGVNASFHHNVMAHHKSRPPRIDGILDKWRDRKDYIDVNGVADLRNNIFYNHATFPPYGAEGRDVQFINNIYKPGPATTADNVRNYIFLASGRRPLYDEDRIYTMHDYDALLAAGTIDPKFLVNGKTSKPVGRVYVDGNLVVGNPHVTANNIDGVRYDDESLKPHIIQNSPFNTDAGEVNTQSAEDAYEWVLAGVGASFARDAVDTRVLLDVKNGTGSVRNGIVNVPDEVGGYPVLNNAPAPLDTDGDGIPDAWEIANGLNHLDASDGWEMFADRNSNYPEAKGWYTNAEVYWYSLVKHVPGAGFSTNPSDNQWQPIENPPPGSSSSSSSVASSSSSSSVSSASSSSVASVPSFDCSSDAGNYFYCDDFSAGLESNWLLRKGTLGGSDGSVTVVQENGGSLARFTRNSNGGIVMLADPATLGDVAGADYYVEARLRVTAISGNKQLYLLARYQDDNNWYGAGLNIQNTPASSRIAVDKMVNGLRGENFLPRFNTSLHPNVWYTVRFSVNGDAITVYLDGVPVITGNNSDLAGKGQIGFFTHNLSFDLDYVKVGNATDVPDRPSQISISYDKAGWHAEANDEPLVVEVTAVGPDGGADSFYVESSDPSVVQPVQQGNSVSLYPLSAGNAQITFISASDASVMQTIEATIDPEFVQPVATYNLDNIAWPAPLSQDNPVDTFLTLTFDAEPTLGVGAIRILDAADDSVVDVINVEAEVDFLGVDPQRLRTVKTRQVRVDGNKLIIQPHNGVLQYGKSYYLAMTANAVTGATLDNKTFEGIGRASGWEFSLDDTAPDSDNLTVSHSGEADFRTLQGALNHAMKNIAADDPVTIELKTGIYEELLFLRNKNNVTIRGESRENTVIQYLNNDKINPGAGGSGVANGAQGGRSVFLIEGADMLTLENLTIKNTTLIGEGGQAETMYFNSNQRLIAKHINLFSEQDTLLVKGYNWFYDSLIAGNVDFIWGGNHVSLFENSEIRTLGDSRGNGGGGYILQARTANATDKGFVFLNSRLTRGLGPLGHAVADNTAWLARSGGNAGYFDNIAFINTRVDAHIRTAGWNASPPSNPSTPSAASGWRQYNIMDIAGAPLNIDGWVLGYTLTEAEYLAEFSSRAQILSAWNNGEGWNPQP